MRKRLICMLLILSACFALSGCAAAEQHAEDFSPSAPAETPPVVEAVPVDTPVAPTLTPLEVATPSPTPVPETPVPETPVPDYYPEDEPARDGLYKLVVYFGTQSVVAYHAEDGQWREERIMICSSGKKTPEGVYAVHTKYRYHSLFGARGQYCSRIIDHFLFHSIPIQPSAGNVEAGKRQMMLEEYEKLGTAASDGCIRLTCADAKWIYDNCDKTTVVIMTKENGPVPTSPPALIQGDPYETAPGLGWDPTDPDEENPYREIYGAFE